MLEDAILKLAADEDWTAETILALLTDFIENEVKQADACLRFLNTRTADAMIEEQNETAYTVYERTGDERLRTVL